MRKNEELFPLITKHFLIKPRNEARFLEEEWDVCLNNDKQENIGKIKFESTGLLGGLQINIDVDSSFEKEKYIAELFYSMSRFVFRIHDVRELSTVCRHDNEHRVRGLEKAGYVMREFNDGSYSYSVKKQKTSWTGVYVIIGLIAGFIIGITISNLWVGTIAGIIIGTIIGIILDNKEQKDPRPLNQ